MENNTDIQPATPESVWAILRELAASQAETALRMKETDRIVKETALQMKEIDRKIDKVRETLDSWANKHERLTEETDRQIDEEIDPFGSWSYNHGRFAEEYFFNSSEKGKHHYFGEIFDGIENGLKGMETNDVFDIVMLNESSAGIIEVKFKAHEDDIPKVLKKAGTFRVNYPTFKNHKVYLGLATLSFYPELEAECIKQGIAIIKQAKRWCSTMRI